MHTIYRIEGEDGKGPYMSSSNKDLMEIFGDYFIHADNNHPSIMNDIPEDYYGTEREYYCACECCESLYDWFSDDIIQSLKNEGYNIIELQVHEIVASLSGKQCFYKAEDIVNKNILY